MKTEIKSKIKIFLEYNENKTQLTQTCGKQNEGSSMS